MKCSKSNLKISKLLFVFLFATVMVSITTSFRDVSDIALLKPDFAKGFNPLFNGKNFDDWQLLLRNGTAEEAKKVFTVDKGGILYFSEIYQLAQVMTPREEMLFMV